jgi:hypothetical protein
VSKKTIEEITKETEEALPRAAWLEAAAAGKRHSDRRHDVGSFGDGAGECDHSLRHHPKYDW